MSNPVRRAGEKRAILRLMLSQRSRSRAPLLQCDNPFWAFSLEVYAAQGVAAECLALQREFGIDVNMLLFCAWLGAARKRLLSAEQFESFEDAVHRWHEDVVKPLRHA